MTVPGDPAAMTAAADALARVAGALDGFVVRTGQPVRAAIGDWRGAAAPVAARRLDTDLDVLARAVDVCGVVGPALRFHAETLERARADALAGARYDDAATGTRIVEGARAALDAAGEDVARVVRDATALLPPPVDAEGGNALDGLRKAGGDALDEVGSLLTGAWDRVNVFSDRFGEAWSETGATISAVATDPMAAGRAVVDGVTAPVAESYRTGGVDEAAARGVGTIATALAGGKGVTKLGRLAPDGPPEAPRTDLVPGGGLQRHEELGGHTLDPAKAHVGATDQQLLDRQAAERRPIPVSTYTDREMAENAISENMRHNERAIAEWLADPARTKPEDFDHAHGSPVGRTAPARATLDDIAETSNSRVVLRKDPTAPHGFYVLTSYPRP